MTRGFYNLPIYLHELFPPRLPGMIPHRLFPDPDGEFLSSVAVTQKFFDPLRKIGRIALTRINPSITQYLAIHGVVEDHRGKSAGHVIQEFAICFREGNLRRDGDVS